MLCTRATEDAVWRRPQASEDDRAGAVEQDAVVDVGLDRTGQHQPLDVAADPLQVGYLVAVADPGHVLPGDRHRVELVDREGRGLRPGAGERET